MRLLVDGIKKCFKFRHYIINDKICDIRVIECTTKTFIKLTILILLKIMSHCFSACIYKRNPREYGGYILKKGGAAHEKWQCPAGHIFSADICRCGPDPLMQMDDPDTIETGEWNGNQFSYRLKVVDMITLVLKGLICHL